jgi:hypothetical protein
MNKTKKEVANGNVMMTLKEDGCVFGAFARGHPLQYSSQNTSVAHSSSSSNT